MGGYFERIDSNYEKLSHLETIISKWEIHFVVQYRRIDKSKNKPIWCKKGDNKNE